MSAESGLVSIRTSGSRASERTPHGEFEPALTHACWLSSDTLLLIALVGPSKAAATASAVCGKTTVALATNSLALRPASTDEPPRSERSAVVLLRLPAGHSAADRLRIVVRSSGRSLRLDPPDLRSVTVGLDRLLRSDLAGLDSGERADVLAFLVAGPGELPPSRRAEAACCDKATDPTWPTGRLQLSKSLRAARQVLRERLPGGTISVAAPQGLNVDAVLAVDDRHFYVQGWLHDEEATPIRLTAVSPEGGRTEILSILYRYRRPDVEQFYGDFAAVGPALDHGWIAHLETPAPSLLGTGWTFEMASSAGSELEVSAPEVTRDPVNVRERILADLHRERLPADRLRAEHIAPALTRLEERRRSVADIESVDQHGTPPESPDVSVVVPLYGRIDFVEHQLAQFVHDPEFRSVDLIYILDSPELAESFRVTVAQLAQLYDVPFRAVVMSHNIGFSGVNNVGAGLAAGRLLVLLNSDVFPAEPGWLGVMARFYDETPQIGALAPKLLYEDDSIQHAGLYFRRLVDTQLWNNEHYLKGLHRILPAANIARPAPAVTAACLMIDRCLYQQSGGLRGMYLQGDYEDSDLCLRLLEKGLRSWYYPSVELYHLEGQSYPSQIRELTGAYNRWLHSSHWGQRLASTVQILE